MLSQVPPHPGEILPPTERLISGAGAGRCRGGNGAQGRTACKKDVCHRLPNRSRDELAAAGHASAARRAEQVTISSDYSPDLAEALLRGRLDVAFLRAEPTFDLWTPEHSLAPNWGREK